MRTATLATCTLNQWAMDFEGNYKRILKTITEAKEKGATYRCGPELEITGYGCADHFYQNDTYLHSWEVVARIIQDEKCQDILIDVGMPVMHKNVAYNCRVILLNKRIILIRPKKKLCDNGMYRESRWFTGWSKEYCTEQFILPKIIRDISGQVTAPIGDAVITTSDTCIGFEICEELWNPDSSLIKQSGAGVEITVNSSGGFHEIGGTPGVVNVIKSATEKCGGVYLFSNLRGCDGDLVYYHGTSHITVNGEIMAMGEQFSLKDTEVVLATVDLDDVVSYRRSICKNSAQTTYPDIDIDYYVTSPHKLTTRPDSIIRPKVYEKGEEIALGPACWLWDSLRRGNYNGILLPMEGDVDSSSSAVIIYAMCNLICKAISEGQSSVLSDVRKVVQDPDYLPSSPKELCNKILITCHFNTDDKAELSRELASEINSNHFSIPIKNIINTILNILLLACNKIFSKDVKCEVDFQSSRERIKMIMLYLFAEMLSPSKGNILIIGVGNADKALLGNYVKYGSFSGDISLTGGVNNENLTTFLKYAKDFFKLSSLSRILVSDKNDECDTKSFLNSEEITTIGELKSNHGPYSMFCKLISKSSDPAEWPKISMKVKQFFRLYSVNFSKKFSIAPCLHLGSYAIVNGYYNQHQMIYNTDWSWQFAAIDRVISLRCIND